MDGSQQNYAKRQNPGAQKSTYVGFYWYDILEKENLIYSYKSYWFLPGVACDDRLKWKWSNKSLGIQNGVRWPLRIWSQTCPQNLNFLNCTIPNLSIPPIVFRTRTTSCNFIVTMQQFRTSTNPNPCLTSTLTSYQLQ